MEYLISAPLLTYMITEIVLGIILQYMSVDPLIIAMQVIHF